jgi:hypothetical protein
MGSMLEHRLKLNDREFIVFILRTKNGCFISISEGKEHKIGALNVSVFNGVSVSTSRVIPSKYNGVFLDLLSQRIASLVNGICIISFNVNSLLDDVCMRYILEDIINGLREERKKEEEGKHGST